MSNNAAMVTIAITSRHIPARWARSPRFLFYSVSRRPDRQQAGRLALEAVFAMPAQIERMGTQHRISRRQRNT